MRTYKTIIVLLAVFFCLRLVAFGQRTRDFDGKRPVKTLQEQKVWTEEEAISLLREVAAVVEATGAGDRAIDHLGGSISRVLATLENPDRLIQAIMDFPAEIDGIRSALIWVLTPYRSHAGVEYFIDSLASLGGVHTQRNAAQAYLRWQAWEKACSLITKCEEYSAFYIIAEDRALFDSIAVPYLRKACREASWSGRTFAAFVLQMMGDSATYKDVAVDIVRNSPLIDDENIENAQRAALNKIQECNIEVISDVARLADSESQYVRNSTLSVLDHFMNNGIDSARIAIEKIAEESEDPELRATAKEKLLRYEEGLQ